MKRAIVLGGGGARGPYQIGVWRAIRELGIGFSIVTGSSVGALNGALMVQGDYDLAVRLWENLTIRDVASGFDPDGTQSRGVLLRRVVEQGGLDVTPLENILRENIDEGKIRKSPVEYGLVSARLPTFQPLELLKAEIPEGELIAYMMASATWFPFFRARKIGDDDYVDGGYTDNLPAELAAKCGATEIIAVDLQGFGLVRSFRHPIPVVHIRSHWDLGDMLAFDTDRARRNMRLGYLDTLRAYRRLEGDAYAFHPGETRRNAAYLTPAIDKLRHRAGVSLFRDRGRLTRVQDMLCYRGSPNRFLERKPGGKSFGGAVTTAAEITGELLGVPPDKTYTFLEFNRLVLEAARQPDFCRTVGSIPGTPRTGRRSRAALLRLVEMLRAAYYRGGVPRSFWRIATLYPAELVAANYLLILEVR